MRLLTILIVMASASALITPVRAQISPPADTCAGISGRVIVQDRPNTVEAFWLLLVPADIEQPIPSAKRFMFATDTSGRFDYHCLEDGDYLLGFADPEGYIRLTPLPETVALYPYIPDPLSPPPQIGDPDVFEWPAMRVSIANGQPVSGIEIVLEWVLSGPLPSLPGGELVEPTPTTELSLPEAGGARGARGHLAGYLAAALGGLAVLAPLSALAWRARNAGR